MTSSSASSSNGLILDRKSWAPWIKTGTRAHQQQRQQGHQGWAVGGRRCSSAGSRSAGLRYRKLRRASIERALEADQLIGRFCS